MTLKAAMKTSADQPIILEGPLIQEFCDLMDKLFDPKDKPAHDQWRKAVRITGSPAQGLARIRTWRVKYAKSNESER